MRSEQNVKPNSPSDLPRRGSPLTSWAGRGKVAVWPVVNIEHYLPGRPGPAIQPHLAHGHDLANSAWRDYGNRVGIWRLLRLFADLGVSFSAALNADVLRHHPDVAEAVVASGAEILGHGMENSTRHHDLALQAEKDHIAGTLSALGRGTGRQVAGWLTPGFAVSTDTHRILAELGLAYTADFCDDDAPYWLDTPGGRLLAIPYSLETNDISLFISMRYTPAQYADVVFEHVRQLCREPGGGRVVALGLHPFLVGQPSRIGHLRECLERLAALDESWFTTGEEICELVQKEEES
ncbi:polysaccharide deacetylase family protein [Nonomuraea angiospora]|uniref:polysaccharide deacetylase family protein n=1 Tax=Nonomuraea angiospora TaxID=46172 RepID=UPI0029BDC5F4|nr:polysaccharide deacetylase family protein [Nonomuraea angiospora]MDX3103363.1 polysaccharide deacetylase family protein [Nonomuraea angiospora]